MGRVVTLREAKRLLGLSGAGDDARLIDLIESASEWIEARTGRTFKERTGLQEFYDSRGGRVLWLRRRPLTTTTPFDIRVDTTNEFNSDTALVEQTAGVVGDFVLDRDFGKLTLVGTQQFFRGPRVIRVDYSAGHTPDSDIPRLAKKAAIYHIGFFFQKLTGKDTLIHQSLNLPQGSTNYIQGVPVEIDELLSSLKLKGIGATTGGAAR